MRRRIDPLEVLDDEHERRVAGAGDEELHGGFERALLEARGRVYERRIAVLRQRKREQRGEERQRVGERAVPREHAFDLRESVVRAVVRSESEPAVEQIDHRIERAVLVVGRAATLERDVRRVRESLVHCPHEPRFANARLAGDEHELSAPLARPREPTEQQTQLRLASDEAGDTRPRVSAGARVGPLAGDAEDTDRCDDALDRLVAEILEFEEPVDESLRRGGDQHCPRPRERKNPRRNVRGVTERELFAVSAGADLTDHDETGVDADPHRDRHALGVREARRDVTDRFDDRKRGVRGAPCGVLVRARIAEVDEDAVAEILRDVAVEALDRLDARRLVGADDFAEVLEVELPGERRRLDEVAEEDRELASLRSRCLHSSAPPRVQDYPEGRSLYT